MRKKLWKDRCRFACFVGFRGTESAGFVGSCFKRAGREIMFCRCRGSQPEGEISLKEENKSQPGKN